MRKDINSKYYKDTIAYLCSDDRYQNLDGIIFAHYLCEQALKMYLFKKNALLISDGVKDTPAVVNYLKNSSTISPKKTITYATSVNLYKEFENQKVDELIALGESRNYVCHSIHDISDSDIEKGVTHAINALLLLRDKIGLILGKTGQQIPQAITKQELNKYQKILERESEDNLLARKKRSQLRYKQLTSRDIKKLEKNFFSKFEDVYYEDSWLYMFNKESGETIYDYTENKCPACGELSYIQIFSPAVDISGEEVGSFSLYECYVCQYWDNKLESTII